MSQDDRRSAGSEIGADQSGEGLPPRYRVQRLDDGDAPQGIVESLLERVFRMSSVEAGRAAWAVRQGRRAECGVYRYEIAETKASEAIAMAGAHHVDLQMTLEPI